MLSNAQIADVVVGAQEAYWRTTGTPKDMSGEARIGLEELINLVRTNSGISIVQVAEHFLSARPVPESIVDVPERELNSLLLVNAIIRQLL